LISLAIIVAFVASFAATIGFSEVDVWWELATLSFRYAYQYHRFYPKNTCWLRRSRRHFFLAAVAVAIVCIAYIAAPLPDVRHRLSMATAYAGLFFLAASLWLGPWSVLRRLPNPISFDRRRDVGIWTGILAILHTAIGLTVHLRGRMWMYFLKRLHSLTLQNTRFGFANFAGLGAALIFLMLLAISNDFSLRTLGTRRWKSLQRWTYVAVVLTVAHGIAYQVVEKRHSPRLNDNRNLHHAWLGFLR
jgi:DMSO/TMAO reductase YedYZ heme-binding membrane subunit